MVANVAIVVILMLLVYVYAKKFKFSNPIHFTLLMGLVFIFILWSKD